MRKGCKSWGCSAWRREGSGDTWGAYKKGGERCFTKAFSKRRSGYSFKLKEGKFTLDIRKKFFTMGVVKRWHWLTREVVGAPSLETF